MAKLVKRAPKKARSAPEKKVRLAPGKKSRLAPEMRPAATADETAIVLDLLWATVEQRREADPALSHSARLLSRGTAKVAQKFGEEAVEALIEAVAGNRAALISESADVLYHLMVVWVDAGIPPHEVWAELRRREGVSGIAERKSRARTTPHPAGTRKIP